MAREAAACGTPVVAFPVGALGEVVDHGRTGFLVEDADAMADAITACAAIDPAQCRAVARERFSDRHMIADYLGLYDHLARRSGPC